MNYNYAGSYKIERGGLINTSDNIMTINGDCSAVFRSLPAMLMQL